ncbi:DNA replication complex GINS protein PSF1-like protein [Tritrichomonas foetus]|uniref:DNA replication complex GINS protein PSF1-like protein n=1 Tax=Tritrichomonas foetus TaxID=1144522 RepID=A0A1J4K010_9EUKA|nr:DNA replication complex GINS protein PSF1-like protein [Tritrichomonas foetus]|eukprot:OHT04753.1 DNA replication complex GINS protein PSF1-like protein [Tritrichomonas foetus]
MSLWSAHICKALQKMEDTPSDFLPPYDEDAVHNTEEIIKMMQRVIEETDESLQHRSVILKLYVERLQSGISLYNRARLNRIVEIRDKSRGIPSPEIRKNMTPHEIEFLGSYSKAVATYNKALDFDVTEPFMPPQGLNAEVKALRDAESIMAGDGYISLRQNDILTLRTNVAKELEKLGFVQITQYLK